MKFSQSLIALAACFLPLIAAAPVEAQHAKIRSPRAQDIIPDSYIVVFNKGVNDADIESEFSSVSRILSKRRSAHKGVGHKYNITGFKGYQIETDTGSIGEIAASPLVAWIEMDGKVQANALETRSGATWGLGRISHKATGSNSYIYDGSAGSGSTVYVLDTGIYIEHSEFEGRAKWGANYISGSPDTDENGHGTHCAGTIAGATYGVASKANLVAVKVLDRDGFGATSATIAGINFVGQNGKDGKSVISMSLRGHYSAAVNSAVESTVSNGVTIVVAAGNDGDDASNYSPASAKNAITVGSVDSTDTRASSSNYGSVVDIFAPGVNVKSASIGGKSAFSIKSGTSMATPHVAGLAAYLIGLGGLSSPAAIASKIASIGTKGSVKDPKGSVNLIAYNGNGA
ncbi:Subtilisin-like protease 1 [Pseudogymnoascus destructans]|uniref:Subtilisin-like protease 1 n=2 Tax=Pseudogymnoascus destructans TaxID=655981 RepID=SUB1_PSED2|nr:Subtilisin-like protease 1 [Pseudogymnoascus destructans]L8G6I7.1 RecName: Full=Subtilisin-like protease 1; AltName: Full=Destructin-2; AltName: Full=Serine protease 1; Short=PdSP1; Flags: Precursor [Pseudogymnoascus destructans 20631-21]ELR07576.1 hypothetical protein GMDG_08491 [Pseudogymnoascus destructans 20631-21]OAF58481.1 Subtilisin-like protease 1 [Pseudogymnoascus destructans]